MNKKRKQRIKWKEGWPGTKTTDTQTLTRDEEPGLPKTVSALVRGRAWRLVLERSEAWQKQCVRLDSLPRLLLTTLDVLLLPQSNLTSGHTCDSEITTLKVVEWNSVDSGLGKTQSSVEELVKSYTCPPPVVTGQVILEIQMHESVSWDGPHCGWVLISALNALR